MVRPMRAYLLEGRLSLPPQESQLLRRLPPEVMVTEELRRPAKGQVVRQDILIAAKRPAVAPAVVLLLQELRQARLA